MMSDNRVKMNTKQQVMKTLKFPRIVFLVLITLVSFSCNKEEDENKNLSSSPLAGRWSLNEVDDGNGLEPFDEYFVWNLNSNGTGFSEYRANGGPLVIFDLIWEVTPDNVLTISQDGGQDWMRERIINQTPTELWTYDLDFDDELRYIKIP